MPIGSAAGACLDLNAHLPLPVNFNQSRHYRSIFDDLVGNDATVALRLRGGVSVFDFNNGERVTYNELNRSLYQNQWIGMMPELSNEITWEMFSSNEHVYTVCEKELCLDSIRTQSTQVKRLKSDDGMYFENYMLYLFHAGFFRKSAGLQFRRF